MIFFFERKDIFQFATVKPTYCLTSNVCANSTAIQQQQQKTLSFIF